MTLRDARRCLLLAIAYVAAGEIGSALYVSAAQLPFIWPPTGVALAAVLLYGPHLWPGIAIGTFVTVMLNVPVAAAAAWITVADVGEVLVAWWLLDRVFQLHRTLDRVRDVIALSLVALGTSIVSGALSLSGLRLLDLVRADQVSTMLGEWWWSHLSAGLVIAPVLLTWMTKVPATTVARGPNIGEVVALAVCVVIVDVALFSGALRNALPGDAAPFYLLPLLLWAGLRFGPRGAATASFAVGTMAIVSATTAHSPFQAVLELEAFVSITAVATLTLSATAIERLRAIHRQAAVQRASLDPIISVDTRGRIIEFNPAAEELFGRRLAQVLGKDASILIPPYRHAAYRRALREGHALDLTGRRFNTTIIRADGRERDVELSITSVNIGGEAIITGFIRDRTEERQAERDRRQAHVLLEEKVRERTAELTRMNAVLARRTLLLRQAEEMAQLGSYLLDVSTGRVEYSDELYGIFGVAKGSFETQFEAFVAAAHPDDQNLVRDTIAKAIETHQPFQIEQRIIRPSGELRYLASSGKVVLSNEGVVTAVAGCCQDITERRKAEEARYRLVDIAESSEDAIVGLSVDMRIESWNAAATKIFGYSREEVIGHSYTLLVASEEVPDLEERIERTIAGEHLPHYELAHRRKDGSVFDASVTLSAIRDRDGTVLGLSKVLRDISQQKNFEARLKSSLVEKEVLLREIHHRVKNNLQVISSLLNLQVATETSEQSRRSLLESQNRIQSMALVHQLLYQSHDLGGIDVTEYLRALAVRLLNTYNVGNDQIELSVDGPSLLLGIDRVIPCGLIVNELVANALDHAFPQQRHGHIWLTLERSGETMLSLTVRDDGIGIPEELLLNDTQTFGLQIARTLTHQLAGSIAIVRHHGTAIRVVFPLYDALTPPPPPPPRDEPYARGDGRH